MMWVWATLWEPALATLGLSYKEGLDVAARGTAGDTMRAVLRRFYGENCDTCIKGKRETHYVGYQDHPHGCAQGKAHR